MEEEDLYIRRERKKRNRIDYVRKASFENYIRILLHNLADQDGSSIAETSVQIIDDLLKNFFMDLSDEAKVLMVASKKRTLTAWDVQQAVIVTLKGAVAKQAISAGHKAIRMYSDMAHQT